MLGPYSSGLTKAIAPVTEQYGVPMVEANGASLQLFNKASIPLTYGGGGLYIDLKDRRST